VYGAAVGGVPLDVSGQLERVLAASKGRIEDRTGIGGIALARVLAQQRSGRRCARRGRACEEQCEDVGDDDVDDDQRLEVVAGVAGEQCREHHRA